MLITCGPNHDRRVFKLELPKYPDITTTNSYIEKIYLRDKIKTLKNNDTIGILVSGGVDSVLLYYLHEGKFRHRQSF